MFSFNPAIPKILLFFMVCWSAGLFETVICNLSKEMVKFIFCLDSRSHVGQEELRNLSWISQTNRVTYFRLSHMYKIFHGHAPPYLLENFTTLFILLVRVVPFESCAPECIRKKG
jgi:hypothetical protein